MDLLMQNKVCGVKLISRSWRTWKKRLNYYAHITYTSVQTFLTIADLQIALWSHSKLLHMDQENYWRPVWLRMWLDREWLKNYHLFVFHIYLEFNACVAFKLVWWRLLYSSTWNVVDPSESLSNLDMCLPVCLSVCNHCPTHAYCKLTFINFLRRVANAKGMWLSTEEHRIRRSSSALTFQEARIITSALPSTWPLLFVAIPGSKHA
jgi:hypothetical protein